MRGLVAVFAMACLLAACPSNTLPVDGDRMLSTLSPSERTSWCQWRADTLAVVNDAGFVECTDSPGWPAGTVAECAANDDVFVECEAALAGDCIEAVAEDPCTGTTPAACDAYDACVAALPPANAVACTANQCSCPNGPNVDTEVRIHHYQDVDWCWPAAEDPYVCNGEPPTECW